MEKKDCGSDKEISMVNYIILNQTKCAPREGVFDINLFPPGFEEFDMKMAQNVKSPWVLAPFPGA